MSIAIGDRLPSVPLTTMSDKGPRPLDLAAHGAGKTLLLIAVPGAFTPLCHDDHMPDYVNQASAFRARGVDEIVCTAVNDIFVLNAWSRSLGAAGKIRMLSDGNGVFAKAVGLDMDLSDHGMGRRSSRYVLLAKDSVVTALFAEHGPAVDKSVAAKVLASLPSP